MQFTIERLIALVIAAAFALALIARHGGVTEAAFKGCAFLMLPLALIFFPDALGRHTSRGLFGSRIDVETPAIFISIMGWILLIGVPVLVYLLQ